MYFDAYDGTLPSSSTIPKEFKGYANYAANTFSFLYFSSLILSTFLVCNIVLYVQSLCQLI